MNIYVAPPNQPRPLTAQPAPPWMRIQAIQSISYKFMMGYSNQREELLMRVNYSHKLTGRKLPPPFTYRGLPSSSSR